MYTSKPIQYLILVSLVFTIPIHPKSLFSYCTDAYQLTKQSVVDVVNGQATTKTKIGVGLAALIITYVLIKCALYKRDEAFLKKRGINIEYVAGDTQDLKKAVEEDDVPLIRMLLKHGAAIHKFCRLKPESDRTPLEVAIKTDPELVKLLLKEARCVDQRTLKQALCFVIREDQLNTNKNIELLLQHDSSNAAEICGYGLSSAAHCNHAALDFLMRYGKNMEKFDEHINGAVFDAIVLNFVRCKDIELLIKYGADVNAKRHNIYADKSDPRYKQIQTPLSHAIRVGAPLTIKFLLQNGAQIEIEEGISAYDYVEDMREGVFHRSKEHVYARLDNHRRDLAKRFCPEVRQAVYTHLPQDPTGIVMQYVDPIYYPLMHERPLKSFEHDDNDGTKEAIEFEKYFCIRREDDNS